MHLRFCGRHLIHLIIFVSSFYLVYSLSVSRGLRFEDEVMEEKKKYHITKEELKKKLTPLQYKVSVENGTEPRFENEYYNNHHPGIYISHSGEPLFVSKSKFDSGTGWPSFHEPLEPHMIKELIDNSHGMKRIEVRAAYSDTHLGHVFVDDPAKPMEKRYCVNSASLEFIPKEQMEVRGYGQYLSLLNESEEAKEMAVAVFAGGCFWCLVSPFDHIDGVKSVVSGYTGGSLADPTYDQVASGETGHAEAVQITYDPSKVSYSRLLEIYWQNIDPTIENRQFCDAGEQYRTAIFYTTEEQKITAENSKKELTEKYKLQSNYTQIVKASVFYRAEDYHQNYYKTNPLRYKMYYRACGREERLEQLWQSSKSKK